MKMEARRIDVAGVPVSAFSIRDATDAMERAIATGEGGYVCATSAHGVVESLHDASLREIHERAAMIVPDGMPLVWMCRALGRPKATRVYGPDLMRAMTEIAAERGYRMFLYGGGDGVAETLRDVLTKRHPGLQIVGVHTPPFRPLTDDESRAVAEEINAAKPDIVWVGLSTPKQERWMARHVAMIDAPVLVGVGAAFDFLADLKTEAPGWLRGTGFEWLYRLLAEPKRLWRRYAVVVPTFLALALRQLVRERLFGRPQRAIVTTTARNRRAAQ